MATPFCYFQYGIIYLSVRLQLLKFMLKFQYQYFILALLIFFVEVFIALFIHDEIIRPYVGDFLVVILIYCFLKSFINLSAWKIAVFVLLFSYTVETLQYYKIVEQIGLEHSKLARIIIGTSFSWVDIIAYSLGIIFVLLIEKLATKKIPITSKKEALFI